MECFVIIVNGWEPLTIITKHSILGVAAAPDPPLPLIDNIENGTVKAFLKQSKYFCSPQKKNNTGE